MSHQVIITGSTAIDQTGFYDGSFKEYQENYQVEALNASVTLHAMRTSFGGCAPNIAYGLQQLGVDAIPLSSAGLDFRLQYEPHLQQLGICTDYITVDDSVPYSATCLMLNDADGNQVIGFYPGPRDPKRHAPKDIARVTSSDLAILGPEVPELTLRQGRQFAELEVPILVDPGQVIPEFSREHITELLQLADYLILNAHELTVIKSNGHISEEDILAQVPEVVVTHGADGVDIYANGEHKKVPAIRNVEIVEVTGCGDAFRAGYTFGILNNLPVEQRAQYGCIMAKRNLEVEETQKYQIDSAELEQLRIAHYD